MLPAHPFRQSRKTFRESTFRYVTKLTPRQADVAEAVTDVAGARLVQELSAYVATPHRRGDSGRDVRNRHRTPAADVVRAAPVLTCVQRQNKGARNVIHMHEVAALQPVLVHSRSATVQQRGCENRENAGVGIGQCLTWT